MNVSQESRKYAGQLYLYYDNWCKITSDPFVLNAILGYKIIFKENPYQSKEYNSNFSKSEEKIAEDCINRLVTIGAIEEVEDLPDQFISKIFTVPKKDGSNRLILNLKY